MKETANQTAASIVLRNDGFNGRDYIFVRRFDHEKWEIISKEAWREAEDKAKGCSAFAETRFTAPESWLEENAW